MPFYHATHRHRLASIMDKGLRAGEVQNFECEPGVYLADNPIIAFGFLLENYFDKADENIRPSEDLKNFIVIVIDDARIDKTRLRPDPNVNGHWNKSLFIYDGVIDVNGSVILDSETLFPEKQSESES